MLWNVYFFYLNIWIALKLLFSATSWISLCNKTHWDIFLACPVIILAPEILYADYGKKVQFQGSVEAKLEYPTDGRWQKLRNGVELKSIDTKTTKYRYTNALPPIQLVINDADFDDIGEYRLQVRISTGWCSSTTIQLQHVYGGMLYF